MKKLLCSKDLFELPIYRLTEEKYYTDFKQYKNSLPQLPESYCLASFGGDWVYNEIIGFFRFYISGDTQIRCVYYDTDTQSNMKTQKKKFIQRSDSYCTQPININADTQEIISAIEMAIEHCCKQLPKTRYVDRSLFDQTFRYIDWHSVLKIPSNN